MTSLNGIKPGLVAGKLECRTRMREWQKPINQPVTKKLRD